MILPRNFVFQNIKITSKKAEFKNLDDSEVFSSDFWAFRNFCSLIDLISLCNLTGLHSLYSPISSKVFLVMMIGSSLAPKWPILASPCTRILNTEEEFVFTLRCFLIQNTLFEWNLNLGSEFENILWGHGTFANPTNNKYINIQSFDDNFDIWHQLEHYEYEMNRT